MDWQPRRTAACERPGFSQRVISPVEVVGRFRMNIICLVEFLRFGH
jgi:hypothetical protein